MMRTVLLVLVTLVYVSTAYEYEGRLVMNMTLRALMHDET